MNNKHKKQSQEVMKESGMKALNNQATLDTWDGNSSIWAYCYTTDEVREIKNKKKIYKLLENQQPCVYFFLTLEDLESYRNLFNYVDSEVNRRINENILNFFKNIQQN